MHVSLQKHPYSLEQMKKYILLYVLTLLLTGCRLGHSVSSSDIASYNTQPDTTRLVSLPAPILYVLAREYESLKILLSQNIIPQKVSICALHIPAT